MRSIWVVALMVVCRVAVAGWVVLPPDDQRRALPKDLPADAKEIKPGDPWANDNKYLWVVGDLQIPE